MYFSFILTLFTFFMLNSSDLLPQDPSQGKVVIKNRILAKVRDKSISVMDVVKQMDLIFKRSFPQYQTIPQARYEFYSSSWKQILDELVDKELVLFDSEDAKIEISSGEIRQKLETQFGPNVVSTLNTLGIGFDEALQLTKQDLMMKRTIEARVQLKAFQKANTGALKNYYQTHIDDFTQKAYLEYKVLSFRGFQKAKVEEAAKLLHKKLTKNEISFENGSLEEYLERQKSKDSSVKFLLSELYETPVEELSEKYAKALKTIPEGGYTAALEQDNRSKREHLYRLFYLKKIHKESVTPFKKAEARIRNILVEQASQEYTKEYVERLRKQAKLGPNGLFQPLPENFEPFSFVS